MKRRTGVLTNGQRATHTYVIGQPGTGKSKAIETWVMQDALAGRGVGVIDPHGDLFADLLGHLSNHPRLWPRIAIIDPCDPDWVVGINPLEAINNLSHERVSLFMTDIMAKIWGLQVSHTPRLLWLMNNTFMALAETNLNLVDLPKFLLDQDFRNAHLSKIRNPLVHSYFEDEFPRSSAAAHQWATPLLNKIGALLFDKDIRKMLAIQPSLDFGWLMDQSKIVLVNLPKGILGEGASALLGAFIVAQMQKAALSRTGQKTRTPFYLYLDEFQNYTTSNIVDILAESRKYALSLTLAHQYLNQLSSQIREAVLNTAGTLISFRIGHDDAVRISREMFVPEGNRNAKIGVRLRHDGVWPQMRLEHQTHRHQPLDESLKLTQLRIREFYSKRRGNRNPSKHKTFTVPEFRSNAGLHNHINRLRTISGLAFGRAKSEEGPTDGVGLEEPELSPGFWSV